MRVLGALGRGLGMSTVEKPLAASVAGRFFMASGSGDLAHDEARRTRAILATRKAASLWRCSRAA
jgi:hypothetical protein